MSVVRISYYSDILCVWAYIGQRRLEQLVADFGEAISIETRFCSVFPDARAKIAAAWKDRGGDRGFNENMHKLARRFPHIEMHPDIWLEVKPRSSASPHLFVKAVELVERDELGDERMRLPYLERRGTRAAWALRRGFFAENRDVATWAVQCEIAEELGIDRARLETHVHSGEALAALSADYDDGQKQGITGSPTFVMNDGRQRLFGNVGYRLLEANVQELLNDPSPNAASWC